jgi:molecular chaperone HscB
VSDPFEILGLEPRFDLDLEAAEARHRELSRSLHPDRHSGLPAAERREALSRSIEANDALRALKDPVRRAEALLARSGVQRLPDKEPKASPAFLMDMLELREELAAAERASDLEKVERMAQLVGARQSRLELELSLAFSGLSRDTVPAPAQVDQIGQKLGELSYFRRLLAEAHAIQDEIA